MRLRAVTVSGHATGRVAGTTGSGDGRSRYGAGRKSPLGLGGTIAVHGLLIGAFLLLPKEVIDVFTPTPPITARNIPIDPAPPPEVAKDGRTDSTLPTRPQPWQPTAADPEVVLPKGDPVLTGGQDIGGDPLPPVLVPPIDLPRAPVLTDAAIDPRALSAFQPDYPGAMIRQGAEGVVTVRVTISPEGRVTDIEKLSASDEHFWLATQRHALRKWRFRPATRDGVAVASTKTLTVRFTLTER